MTVLRRTRIPTTSAAAQAKPVLRRPPAPKSDEPKPRPALRRPVPKRVIPIAAEPATEETSETTTDTRELHEPTGNTDHIAVMDRYAAKVKNPLTAIRAKCVHCCNGSLKEVALCNVKVCPLHPFRMQINPFNKKTKARLARDTEEGDEGDGDE